MAFIKEMAVLTVSRSKSNHARDYTVWPIAIKSVQGIFKSLGIKKPHSTLSEGACQRERVEGGMARVKRERLVEGREINQII